jgi:hypothetical protein
MLNGRDAGTSAAGCASDRRSAREGERGGNGRAGDVVGSEQPAQVALVITGFAVPSQHWPMSIAARLVHDGSPSGR